MVSKLAHDVSSYLYPTLQSSKHGRDEDAPPIGGPVRPHCSAAPTVIEGIGESPHLADFVL
jgi:hypothetical protein